MYYYDNIVSLYFMFSRASELVGIDKLTANCIVNLA